MNTIFTERKARNPSGGRQKEKNRTKRTPYTTQKDNGQTTFDNRII